MKGRYKVYLFTNTIDLHDEINSRRNLYENFDGVYKSFEHGFSKLAGEDAYVDVLKKIKGKPEECMLIDDRKSNVEQAKGLGMKAILYKDNDQLRRELKQINREL